MFGFRIRKERTFHCPPLCDEKVLSALTQMDNYFIEKVASNHFTLTPSRRFSLYYNSFLPKVECRVNISPSSLKMKVQLIFSFTKEMTVFLVAMCIIVFLFEILAVFLAVKDQTFLSAELLAFPCFLIGVVLFVRTGFSLASNFVFRKIRELLTNGTQGDGSSVLHE